MPPEEPPSLADELRELRAPMLTKRLFRVIWTRKPGIENDDYQAALPAHFRWQLDLEARGILFASGPIFGEDGGPTMNGMTILRAESAADVHAMVASEPYVTLGFRTYEVHGWDVNEGSITVQVSIGTGRATWS